MHDSAVFHNILTVVAVVLYLDKHQFAADAGRFIKGLYLDDIQLFIQLLLDLFNGPLVAAADNCHAGYSRVIRLSYRKGIDIKASSGKQARYLAQDTGSVFNKNRVYFFHSATSMIILPDPSGLSCIP